MTSNTSMSDSVTQMRIGAADTGTWLSVVGVGDDGWEGLGKQAREAVFNAGRVAGGARHLAMLPEVPNQQRTPWGSRFSVTLNEVIAGPHTPTAVLASGDPMFFGVGATIASRLAPDEFRIIPHISSLTLACGRLGWSWSETQVISICGRPVETLHAELFDGAQLIVLSADGRSPAQIAALLCTRRFGGSTIRVLEHLGSEREHIREWSAAEMPAGHLAADLNLVAISCVAEMDAKIFSRVPGLPESAYETDGQITKCEVRAITLARLSPRPGELLWDIGSGSGSISIEWMRAAPRARAFGIEPRPDRAERARKNAARLGVPGLHVIDGAAPAALAGLDPPNAIFIGGGLTTPDLLATCVRDLRSGGRLVANAVTLEGEAVLLAAHRAHGGGLARISVDRSDAIGGFHGWRPAMPVTQWYFEKPRDAGTAIRSARPAGTFA